MKDKAIRLLLVEDDKVDQLAFERFVRRENLPYNYTIAGSVAEGKEILKSTSFDVVISDYMLGDGTSFELFDQFMELPVIVTTGTGNEDVAVEAMKLGACDYIIKDPEGNYFKTLPTTVSLALKRKQNEKELKNYHENLEAMVAERTAELQVEIADRKKAEATIRKSEEQWDRTFNSFTDIVTLQDTERRIVKANQAACAALDLSCDEIIGHYCYELFSGTGEPCLGCPLLETGKALKSYTEEIYHEKLDKDFLVSASPVFDERGELEYIAHVAKDITETKQLQTQLLQSQKMEAVGLMAGGMAHNFNNNLSIILGNIELSQMKLPKNSEAVSLLKNAKIAVLRSRDLVQNILTYSRESTHEKAPVQLPSVIDETIELLHSTIPSTVSLQQVIDTNSLAVTINANSSQIQEALINLCNNAVHAMKEKGELTIELDTVDLQTQDIPTQYKCIPGCYAKLSVRDSGSGMAAETIDKIFDPFFTTKAVNEGTGMGLSTVMGIVAHHDGLIKVKSTLGQGSAFDLYFPVIETQKLEMIPALPELPRGTEKILFLDDEEMLANVWSQMLSEFGYQISIMTSSTETLKLFTANPDYFDLVITDQTMPDLSGKDLIKELLNIRADLPTILCTGYSTIINEEGAKELGIRAFCMKPLDLSELVQTVRRVLDEGKA